MKTALIWGEFAFSVINDSSQYQAFWVSSYQHIGGEENEIRCCGKQRKLEEGPTERKAAGVTAAPGPAAWQSFRPAPVN